MRMTTGPVVIAVAPSESHQEIVRKARALAVKDPSWRPPVEAYDELSSVLIAAHLMVRTKVHYFPGKDVIEGLNAA